MDPGFAKVLLHKEVIKYTNNFSEENLLGTFQFGKVYRGIITEIRGIKKPVMVKIWEDLETLPYLPGDNESRLMCEVVLLRHERFKSLPGMIELHGYLWLDGHVEAVYNFNPLDTVHNLVPKDSFTWLQRIKTALGFAHLVKFLHMGNPPYTPFLIRNISAAHIVVDEQYNPKLFDFGMISGGFFRDATLYEDHSLYGCDGYVDPSIERSGKWSKKTDVFAFGVILLNLITKRIYTEEEGVFGKCPIYIWALGLYQPNNSDCESKCSMEKIVHSLVHQSLFMDCEFSLTDGCKIIELAMKCVDRTSDERPSMKQVIKCLKKLQVVKKHAKFLDLAY